MLRRRLRGNIRIVGGGFALLIFDLGMMVNLLILTFVRLYLIPLPDTTSSDAISLFVVLATVAAFAAGFVAARPAVRSPQLGAAVLIAVFSPLFCLLWLPYFEGDAAASAVALPGFSIELAVQSAFVLFLALAALVWVRAIGWYVRLRRTAPGQLPVSTSASRVRDRQLLMGVVVAASVWVLIGAAQYTLLWP